MLWILGPCSKIHISASRYWAWQPEKQPQPLTTFHEGVGCESKGDEGCRRNGLAEMWTVMKISIIPLTARGPFGKKTKNCPQKKSSDCKKQKQKQKNNNNKKKQWGWPDEFLKGRGGKGGINLYLQSLFPFHTHFGYLFITFLLPSGPWWSNEFKSDSDEQQVKQRKIGTHTVICPAGPPKGPNHGQE